MQPLDKVKEAFDELHIHMDQEPLLPQWKDITEFLTTATEEMEVGQLVRLPSFTLFDAMSAIEMMDPRMDTGMATPKVTYDIHQSLSPLQVLSMMDSLLIREMAWISGHSLSQTVYTCIYFHHIQQLDALPMPTLTSSNQEMIMGILRAYLLATVKCCHLVWLEMTQGNIYEEEDFTTNLFGLSLDLQKTDVVILNDLDAAIMLLNHMINTSPTDTLLVSLLNRVTMRKSFMLSLIYLSQQEGSHLTQAKRELDRLLSLLAQADFSEFEDVSDAFDPNISYKLTTQTPPRPVQLPDRETSYREYGLLVKRLRSICHLPDYPSVTSLMHYFIYFAAQVPYPDAFSRSKLNTLFFHQQRIFGKTPVAQFMLQSIQEIVQPPAYWLTHAHATHINQAELLNAHDTLKGFLERISMVFVEYFKVNCHNRSRQRRMLPKVIAEWEILQEEASQVDQVFHQLDGSDQTPYYFSSWAYHLKMLMMEKVLLLGFELELYGTHEYIMIYWYTQNVLYSHAYLLERISTYVVPSKQKDPLGYLRTQQLWVHAKKTLSEAILKTLLIAQSNHQWKTEITFDDEATRYQQRFKSFSCLASPAHPSYSQFRESIKLEVDQDQMLTIIRSDLKETKKTLDLLLAQDPLETQMTMCADAFREDLKNTLRVIVANQIGLNRVLSLDTIHTAFKYHPWFTHLT